MTVKCEWVTCKHNADGECRAEAIDLRHVDNDEWERDQVFEGLQCQQYKYRKGYKK